MINCAGTKKDVWLAIDPATGVKIHTLTMDGAETTCPLSSRNILYLGRTGMYIRTDVFLYVYNCESFSTLSVEYFLFSSEFCFCMFAYAHCDCIIVHRMTFIYQCIYIYIKGYVYFIITLYGCHFDFHIECWQHCIFVFIHFYYYL